MRPHQTAAIALTTAVCAVAVVACGSQATADPSSAATATTTSTSTGASTGGAITTAGATHGGVTACAASQLRIALTRTGALAGQAGGYLRFTNDSHATCRITGWPVVAGLTSSGNATTLRHARSTMYGAWRYTSPLPVVTLRPGDAAYAVVAADDLPVGSQTRCPAPDTRLRVAAPGSKTSVLISAWLPGARSYLPTCASIGGSPSDEVSTITTLSRLAH